MATDPGMASASTPAYLPGSESASGEPLPEDTVRLHPAEEERHSLMARSLNKVMLIGNLGADPEIRTTPSGTRIAKARIATSERFTDRSGQQQERTDWHNITFFGKLADIVEQYVSKGDRIFVEGRIEYSQTESDQGEVKYWTDIVVRDMLMLGSGGGAEMGGAPGGPKGASKGGSSGGAGRGPDPDFSEPDDDLPF